MAKQLAYYVHLDDDKGEPHVFGPEDTVPAWARKKITNPSAWADGEADDEADDPDHGAGGSSDEKVDYTDKAWTKAKLEETVAERNEGRDDEDLIEVEAPGNKPELIAALQADDVAQAANTGA